MNKEHISQILRGRSIFDESTGCYLYQGYIRPDGKGEFHKQLVHRLSAWIHLDYDMESSLQVNHVSHCLNKNCWNPIHLYIGTQADNMRDCQYITETHVNIKKGASEICKRGHLYADGMRINSKGARVCTQCEIVNKRNQRKKQKETI